MVQHCVCVRPQAMAVGMWEPPAQILPAAGESFGFGGAESDFRSKLRCGMG